LTIVNFFAIIKHEQIYRLSRTTSHND
jgi:hypothetical protein